MLQVNLTFNQGVRGSNPRWVILPGFDGGRNRTLTRLIDGKTDSAAAGSVLFCLDEGLQGLANYIRHGFSLLPRYFVDLMTNLIRETQRNDRSAIVTLAH